METEELSSLLSNSYQGKATMSRLIHSLSETKELEMFGSMLSPDQMMDLLHSIEKDPQKLLPKLGPILVGIRQPVFRRILVKLSPDKTALLKSFAASEAIQSHLTILSHELTLELEEYIKSLEWTSTEFHQFPLEDVCPKDIEKAYKAIHHLTQAGNSIKEEVERALSIAWQSNRVDLIDQLGQIKEITQRLVYDSAGSTDPSHPLKGSLQEILENRLFSIFAGNNETEVLADDTPAIEAITRFSIWYLKDYWDLGLLQNYSKKKIEHEEHHHTLEDNPLSEQLHKEAKTQLSHLGLNTLADLKRECIFSRAALKKYISKNAVPNVKNQAT